MPGLEIDDPVTSLVWLGRTESVQFGVRVPPETPPGTVVGTLSILLGSVPVGHVKFKLAIEHEATSAPSEPQGDDARRYSFAFVSYATHDRPEVLPRVQMLRINRIGYFQDVLSLQPGDRWAKRIEAGIDRCDLFLLFWSEHAKDSEWVRKEVEYALGRKRGDDLEPPEIYPVPIKLPPVPPWPELAHLHFNDPLLYFIVPREGREAPRRPEEPR
jgi:TIR domain